MKCQALTFLFLATVACGSSGNTDDAAPEEAADGCEITTIKSIYPRLGSADGEPYVSQDWEGGATLIFANNVGLTGYGFNTPDIVRSQRVGDTVEVCLIAVPTDCPPGDDRGKIYRVSNKRLGVSYDMQNSLHMCGGA